MTERELKQYLLLNFPKENDKCEWKEFKNLKNLFYGTDGKDVVSYVSAISNMNGGHLVIGVEDQTLTIQISHSMVNQQPRNLQLLN